MEKLNFQKIRIEKGLTSRAVADAANIPLREEFLFELGATVSKEVKHKIIHAFSILTGQDYALSDFEWGRRREERVSSGLVNGAPTPSGQFPG